jgi:cytochrome oxidase Cu insertion factor (SCO1/SenC/PrrC family)
MSLREGSGSISSIRFTTMSRSSRFTRAAALLVFPLGLLRAQHEHHDAVERRYARSVELYRPPAVALKDQHGRAVRLDSLLDFDGSVMLQFIFTTCPTICPIMSATLGAVQEKLGSGLDRVRMISISIDPENDTPGRLAKYAAKFKARRQWIFLTGKQEDTIAVEKAFDAYQGSKMRHLPLTFLRGSRGNEWVRLDGLTTAADLIAEYRRLMKGTNYPELGKRIYREGVLPSGGMLQASVGGDVVANGSQWRCEACHRRSGLGSTEGGTFIPPLTAESLFQPTELRRADLFGRLFEESQPIRLRGRTRSPLLRPAYTDQSLAAALRSGVDPAGRKLDSAMPRYRLSDGDLGHLAAYLKTLGVTPPPGVDEAAIHFGTVVSDGVDPVDRESMLNVLRTYFRTRNQETENEVHKRGRTAWSMNDLYIESRRWMLDVWELKSPADSWKAQLDEYYRKQPVFALIGGIAAGSWQPIADFCDRTGTPSFFPETSVPADGDYTVYFSRGLVGEAAALARHLQDFGAGNMRAVQVYRKAAGPLAAAQTLRGALHNRAGFRVRDRIIPTGASPPPEFWIRLLRQEQPGALILWVDDADYRSFELSARNPDNALVVYASCSLTRDLTRIAASVRPVYLTCPFESPEAIRPAAPDSARIRSWLTARGVPRGDARVQFDAYFAAVLLDHSMKQMTRHLDRDYLLETIERETETSPNPGIFPRLSLGPGQRFASKGVYVVRQGNAGLKASGRGSDWIVP